MTANESNDSQPNRRIGAVPRYALAIILVGFATLVTRRTQPVLGEISPFFFTAVMLSAWFCGIGPGLLATALAGWASAYFFYDIPVGSGRYGWDDALRLIVFLAVALLMSFLMHMRRKAERALRNANDHLELRVRQRTVELEDSNRLVRESEEGFRALVEGVTDCAICLLDQHGRIVRWNSGAERIQGYPESEILHRNFDIFFSPQDREDNKPARQLARTAQQGRQEDEGWRIRKDGSAFWASVIITSLHDDGGALRGFAYVARDITEVKRLEKEVLEISESEQRRIGHDLHDGLGQELTGLSFLSQNLGRKLAEQSLPEAGVATRISTLINSAIDKTRELAQGLSPVEWGPDGLAAALRNLAAGIRETHGIPCEMRGDRAVRVTAHPDAIHLYRIAQEALNNAARHGHASAIWISLQSDGRDVILSVEDNGTGIQSPSTASKGMGLHLMPYRARMIGASFGIQPRIGGGTIIRCVYRDSAETNESPKPSGAAKVMNPEGQSHYGTLENTIGR